jgi:hypothetical protein
MGLVSTVSDISFSGPAGTFNLRVAAVIFRGDFRPAGLIPVLPHLAFHAGPREAVDALAAAAPARGWTLLFPETHPYAGGPDHYAAYLANTDGFEVELVAQPQR